MDAEGPVPKVRLPAGSEEAPKRGRHAWGLVIALSFGVAVAGGAGVGVAVASTSSSLPVGSRTATITWKPEPLSADAVISDQHFRGIIAGLPVVGVAASSVTQPPSSTASTSTTVSQPSSSTASTHLANTNFELLRWQGAFAGRRFDLGVFAQYPTNPSATAGPADDTNPAATFPKVTIVGTWGSEKVLGQLATPSAAELKSGKGPLSFHGTIGDLKVRGEVFMATGTEKVRTGRATFTVSK